MRADLEAAVAAAIRAPSIHNTQPWLFHLDDDRIELFADFTRQLHVLDPTGRQLYVSCGAVLNHLKVALRGAGCNPLVTLLPDDDKTHLATVVVLPGAPPDPTERALADAIAARHTQREPFAGRRVEHDRLEQLRRAAEAEGAWLAVLQARDDQIALAVLLSHADQAEIENPAYVDEIRAWRRTEPGADGIPDAAIPVAGTRRHSEVVVRDFALGSDSSDSSASPQNTDDDNDVTPPDERPALVILGTDADSPAQWLKAGQALSRLLLQATVLDLRASMLGQVIDLPGIRSQLRREVRLVGEPQMVLRIGYGPPAAATPRRELADLLS